MASSIQDKLAEGIQKVFPDAEVKKINKDNYLDIHIPSANPKRGSHLFFNTAKEEIKVGFFCRDEEFVQSVLARDNSVEEYSQGIRLLGNTSFSKVDDAITAAIDFLAKISGNAKEAPKKKVEEPAHTEVKNTKKEKSEKSEVDKEVESAASINEVLGSLLASTEKASSELGKTAVKEKETAPVTKETNKPAVDPVGSPKTGPFSYSFEENRVKKVKRLSSAERQQFLASIKENLFTVPVPELVVQLKSLGLTIHDARGKFITYPYLNLLPSILENKIDEINLKLLKGEIKLGQDLQFVQKHFRNTKVTTKSVSKNGEKIELTCYAHSKSIDKEIVALVCKFENDKLISFDDKRDKVEKHTLYQFTNTVEQFQQVCMLTPSETLQCIELNELTKEIDGRALVDFVLKSPKLKSYSSPSSAKFDLLVHLGLIQHVKQPDELFNILLNDTQIDLFLPKLAGFDQSTLALLPVKKMVDCFIDLFIGQVKLAKGEFMEATVNPTAYILDGSSVLVDQMPKNFLLNKANIVSSLTKYTVEIEKTYSFGGNYKEKTTVYSLNEIIDKFIVRVNEFIKQLGGLASKGLTKEDIDSYQSRINEELTSFSEVKNSSKAKAGSFVVASKKGKKSSSLVIFGVIALIIFLVYQCS
jgi:hypothetical protein